MNYKHLIAYLGQSKNTDFKNQGWIYIPRNKDPLADYIGHDDGEDRRLVKLDVNCWPKGPDGGSIQAIQNYHASNRNHQVDGITFYNPKYDCLTSFVAEYDASNPYVKTILDKISSVIEAGDIAKFDKVSHIPIANFLKDKYSYEL